LINNLHNLKMSKKLVKNIYKVKIPILDKIVYKTTKKMMNLISQKLYLLQTKIKYKMKFYNALLRRKKIIKNKNYSP
jgi:hypothetical protein